jgi:polyisoprenyl-phosphate glycosyltransferase
VPHGAQGLDRSPSADRGLAPFAAPALFHALDQRWRAREPNASGAPVTGRASVNPSRVRQHTDGTRTSPPRYSIVVPLYNERDVLPELYRRLRATLAHLHGPAEIIFVNDGSSDGTLGILRTLQFDDKHVRIVSLSRNFGHQVAVSAGLSYAEGDAVAVLDGDLQDPPELLPDLFAKLDEGWDVAYGIRRQRRGGILKRICYFIFYRLLHRLADIDIPLDAGDFCAMRRRIVDHLNRLPETDRFVRGLRAWIGFRQIGVPYERDGRRAGVPKYTISKLVQLSLDGLLSFSYAPLRWLAGAGFILCGVSFLGILVIVYRYLFTPYVPGYTSLAILVLFFGGVQLLTGGLIGEYVGRTAQQVKGRPLYLVDELIGFEGAVAQPSRR